MRKLTAVQSRIPMDQYVVETLMADLVGHDRHPSAFLVCLHLWTAADGHLARPVRASHRQIAVDIGIARSTVETAISRLKRRHLVRVEQDSATSVPAYTVLRPWLRGGA